MKTWQPVTIENSRVDGSPAKERKTLWNSLHFPSARPYPELHAISARRHTLHRNDRIGRGVAYSVTPDRVALELEVQQQVLPMPIPPMLGKSVSPTGWIWLLSDTL